MSDDDYRKCLKLERDRERSRREYEQGRFESSMLSLDRLTAEIDASKAKVFSDQGAGAEKVYAVLDGETPENVYARRLAVARVIVLTFHPELLEVFDQIVKNGSNRTESICEMTLSGSLRKPVDGKSPRCVTGAT